MSAELEAEIARLRAEVKTLTAQRNSGHRKAKHYFRKWKSLVQEQEAAPTTLKLMVGRLQKDLDIYSKADEFSEKDLLVWRSLALYLERLLGSVPKLQEEALLKISTSPDRPLKPQNVIETMARWLKSQVEYKKQSRNDISYGWGDSSDEDELFGEQEAYKEALNELQRLRS